MKFKLCQRVYMTKLGRQKLLGASMRKANVTMGVVVGFDKFFVRVLRDAVEGQQADADQ